VTPRLHLRGVVLPGDDVRDLWIHDGRVTYERIPGAETVTGGWIVPGLVDAHCHVGVAPGGPVTDTAEQERQALADRDAGALLLRDCGTPVDTRWIDDRDDLPKIVHCGRHVGRSKRYIRDLAVEVEPPELAATVGEQARRSDGWVKIVGDWIDRDLGDLGPCWDRDSLTAAVDAAHAEGARVTCHVFGSDALPDLLAAGVDCVEHGTGLTEDLVALMADHGTALVPTLINVANFPAFAMAGERKFPTYAATMRRLHDTAADRVRAAYEAGVPIYAGSDAGGSLRHGLIAREVRALHVAGLPAADALGAASWRAREWLGRPSLGEGDPADLCVYARNPLADLDVLSEPALVVLRGQVMG
jgi:imidazolonepropionase-like amidohydrolase